MNRRDLVRTLAGGGVLAALAACSSPRSSARRTTSRSIEPTTVQGREPTAASAADSNGSTVAPTAAPETQAPAPEISIGAAPSAAWAVGDPAIYANRGDAASDLVALTFHFAGDQALVVRLLDLLKADAVKSTLFAVGDWLTAYPSLGHRAVADGHELGNHTKSHQSMLLLDRAHVHTEIAGGGEALVPFIGSIGNWFRPSGTDVPTPLILEEAGRVGYPVSVGYDIDSRDYTEPGTQTVVANVRSSLHPGAIVSLHFGHRDTIDALPAILDAIAVLGLRTATTTELLGLRPG
jgi:peptidoglycan/xylan/chitin deacetylase (PgdA/CDA1 family)